MSESEAQWVIDVVEERNRLYLDLAQANAELDTLRTLEGTVKRLMEEMIVG